MLKGFKKICDRGNRTGKKQNTTEVSLQTNPYNFDGYATMPMDMLPS